MMTELQQTPPKVIAPPVFSPLALPSPSSASSVARAPPLDLRAPPANNEATDEAPIPYPAPTGVKCTSTYSEKKRKKLNKTINSLLRHISHILLLHSFLRSISFALFSNIFRFTQTHLLFWLLSGFANTLFHYLRSLLHSLTSFVRISFRSEHPSCYPFIDISLIFSYSEVRKTAVATEPSSKHEWRWKKRRWLMGLELRF